MIVSGLSFSPLFTKLLSARGLTQAEDIEFFLSADLKDLHDPLLMKGVSGAAERIRQAVRSKEKILIHGDYDVDGITGAAVVARTLSKLEAICSVFLPDRKEDGYGVSEDAIRRGAGEGVKIIITVDCGITAKSQIELARSLGLDVIVIDHHKIPAEGLPPANFILNPLQEDCAYPFKELSAAGLAFKLSCALLGPEAHSLLDLTTLSTICDVAPLISENRILVKRGLEQLSKRTNPGLRALAASAKMRAREINVGHVGFMLGPRINASGRMSSPQIALRLLMTDSAREAQSLAQILEEENKARQREERQVLKEAIREAERTFHMNRDRVIVVARDGWHAGVIGIVAARLVERFHRPAVVIAIAKGMGKGSGRSIKGFHLYEAFAACAHLMEEFGGHAQAAGLVIREDQVADLRKKINEAAHEKYERDVFIKQTPVDLEISLSELRASFLDELKLLEPHGAGNPRPIFLTKGLRLRGKPLQISPQSYKFWLTDGTVTAEALWADRAELGSSWLSEAPEVLDIAYSVKTKIWDGIESLVLEVKEFKLQS